MLKTIACHELDIEVHSQGKGPALILCHGGPGAEDYLDGLVELLPEGFEILRYDQRGGGKSKGPGPYTVAQQVADLEMIRQELGIEQWILMGHSWGAFLTLAYAAKHPERVQALVHLNGTGVDKDWQKVYRVNRRKALEPTEQLEYLNLKQDFDSACAGGKRRSGQRIKALNFKADLHDTEHVTSLLKQHQYTVQRQIQDALIEDWNTSLNQEDFREQVKSLVCPALFIHGNADPRPSQGAQELAKCLEQGQYVALSDCGHYPWIETPKHLQEHLNSFLDSLHTSV